MHVQKKIIILHKQVVQMAVNEVTHCVTMFALQYLFIYIHIFIINYIRMKKE